VSVYRLSDLAGLLELFRGLAGRRLLGAVDGGGWLELVFEGDDGNLVSFGTEPPFLGRVEHGFVSQELVRDGYLDE
jgi:hypothetical protein